MLHRFAIAVGSAALLLSILASSAAAGGPPSLAFYVDDVRYRTIATPTDLSNSGAPDQSFDRIYAMGGDLINVAEAAPTDTAYNGGRWQVYAIDWLGHTPIQFTNDADILQATEDGYLAISSEPVQEFVCPAIPAN